MLKFLILVMDLNIARIDRLLEPLAQAQMEVALHAAKAMRLARQCLVDGTDRTQAIRLTMQAANLAAAWAQDESKSGWVLAEQASRGAMCAFLTLTQQFDQARDVAAWSAHWSAANQAVKEGKPSCTEDALRAWKRERSYGRD